MRITIVLGLMLVTTSLLATVEARLPNKHIAYYGSQFYAGKVTKESLFAILNGAHISSSNSYDTITGACARDCYTHTPVGYSKARKILFGELYVQSDGKGKYVTDVYCGKKFYFRAVDDVSNMGNSVNIEHTWPQSKFNGRFSKELQKSDLHHLYPTDSKANSERGNHPFGTVEEHEDQLRVENCDDSHLGRPDGDLVFTPPTRHRGNVARALFYFATRYQMDIPADEEKVLREWHKNDPVDATERNLHEAIAKHQLNRNPFVDFPELAEKISNL